MSENYRTLLPEIAETLNMSVSELENKPADIQRLLCHIYQRNFKSDKPTIQKALGEVISLNIQTKKEIETAEKEKEISLSAGKTAVNNEKRSLIYRMEQIDKMLKYREEGQKEAARRQEQEQQENINNREINKNE